MASVGSPSTEAAKAFLSVVRSFFFRSTESTECWSARCCSPRLLFLLQILGVLRRACVWTEDGESGGASAPEAAKPMAREARGVPSASASDIVLDLVEVGADAGDRPRVVRPGGDSFSAEAASFLLEGLGVPAGVLLDVLTGEVSGVFTGIPSICFERLGRMQLPDPCGYTGSCIDRGASGIEGCSRGW